MTFNVDYEYIRKTSNCSPIEYLRPPCSILGKKSIRPSDATIIIIIGFPSSKPDIVHAVNTIHKSYTTEVKIKCTVHI